jgi:dolichol-phosphate mannosyltransferase
MPHLSLITAFLDEEANLPTFKERLRSVLDQVGVEYEIVLVDDHSGDGSPHIARLWAQDDSSVRYIRLSRNCGSHAAFSAGLANCTGDCAILLAADLQDPPEMIPLLLEKWHEGYDVVWAARKERLGESWTTLALSRLYYRLMRTFAMPEMHRRGADFLLMDRKVIDAYNAIPEKNTSFLALILWMGFRQATIEYDKQARFAGNSKWSISKKLKLFADSIVSFSYAPIRCMSWLGILVSILGFLYALFVFVNGLRGATITGWASLMVAVLILGGLQLVMLGILGEYIWRAYDEGRGRPRYIIEEQVNVAAAPTRLNGRQRGTAGASLLDKGSVPVDRKIDDKNMGQPANPPGTFFCP